MFLGYNPRFFSVALWVGVVLAVGTLVVPKVTYAASWSTWTKRSSSVFAGQYGVASDPSVTRDATGYSMFYTCMDWTILDPNPETFAYSLQLSLCQARSLDGIAWQSVPTTDYIEGLALRGRKGQWDEHLETSFLLKNGTESLLYYAGYREPSSLPMEPSFLNAASSVDGVTFSRVSSTPILASTPGWYDNDAIFSPTIIKDGTSFVMVYAGHCYTNCKYGFGVFLLAATSSDGRTWTKVQKPILQPSLSRSWMTEGVAEPSLVKGPDGAFYLFFTGVAGELRTIGVARSTSIFGTWEVNPTPLISPTPGQFTECGVFAPSVRIEGRKVRMWYHGNTCPEIPAIGYAESPWPLYR
jgi:hypothetical protein